MLVLSKNDMQQIFTMKDAINSNIEAFKFYSNNQSKVPQRINIPVDKYNASSLFMPGYVENMDALGIKIVSVFPENTKQNKPVVPAQMILLDGKTGEVCCIMDGTYLTQLRTGAGAGAATKILSKKESKIGALIGTGGQAMYQLEAMLCARELEEVRVFSKNPEKVKDFVLKANEKLKKYNCKIVGCKTSDEAIEDADIITTITSSSKPVFDGRKVKKGAHINGVGSFTKDMQEIDTYTVCSSDKIYIDSRLAALKEAGDLIIPLENKNITNEKITGEIGEVFLDKIKARETDEEITFFKSVGIAVQDVVTACEIYKRALENKIGLKVQI